ncbi:MAG: amino acid adenylation domain-containing protein [Planctomycetaceae bacterium]
MAAHFASGLTESGSDEIQSTVGDWFERQALRCAARIAIRCGSIEVTYAALNASANRIARAIGQRTELSTPHVALLFSEQTTAIAAMLGTLKAGRAYVPLDPNYPTSRTAYMLEDSQAVLILTDRANADLARELGGERVPVVVAEEDDQSSAGNRRFEVTPENIAYVLYTSGSTGKPKGVLQTHRNLLHFVRSYSRGLAISAADRVTMFSSFSFSASLMDIYGALLNGATLLPLDLRAAGLASLPEWLIREKATVYHSVPTVFRNLLASLPPGVRFPDVRVIDLGGEPVFRRDVELFKRHFRRPCRLVNHLAFTEASVSAGNFITHDTTISSPRAPIGHAADGVTLRLVDDQGRDVTLGEVGEIVVYSPFLSPGYWRQPELTAATFSQTDLGRGYRSGDLGRLLPDGQLEHLGRQGPRVKVRGHSIETAEVEQALLGLDTIREAVVLARDDIQDEPSLIAYVVSESEAHLSETALRDSLNQILPEYMVPSHFVALPALPLTATGKIDRRALPAPVFLNAGGEGPRLAPHCAVETSLLEIWQEVLGRSDFGIEDDFFVLGGNSLRAFRMLLDIEATLGVRLPPSALVEAPTIGKLGAVLSGHTPSGDEPICLVALQSQGTRRPLFVVPPAAKTVLIFRELASCLGEGQPVYAFQHLGLDGRHMPHRRIEPMAALYVEKLREIQPQGPYCLAGMCLGGIVAHEMALKLQAAGEEVSLLAVLDTRFAPRPIEAPRRFMQQANGILGGVCHRVRRAAGRITGRAHVQHETIPQVSEADEGVVGEVMQAHSEARQQYRAGRFCGKVSLFYTAQTECNQQLFDNWHALASEGVERVPLPGAHRAGPDSFIRQPHVDALAEKLMACLNRANSTTPATIPLHRPATSETPGSLAKVA